MAFIRMIRLSNLLFITLTQLLFQYCIILPLFRSKDLSPVFSNTYLVFLVLSSVFIAAAGYIINDYFDVNIDQVNKPEMNVVDKIISRRWAMLWHSVFSFTGVVLGFYIGYMLGIFWIGLMNFLCSVLLFVYSTTFKKRLLSGNIIISLLTAWVVGVLGLSTFYAIHYNPGNYPGVEADKLLRFTFIYAAFAFIISLVRESIKDMEDIQGDQKYGCRTMPIVWGIRASKVYTSVWIIVLLGSLIALTIYLMQYTWWGSLLYSLLLLITPIFILLRNLFRAFNTKDFHNLSNLSKLIMLTGILSMIIFYFYL